MLWIKRWQMYLRCVKARNSCLVQADKWRTLYGPDDSEVERLLLIGWFNDYAGNQALKARSLAELHRLDQMSFGEYLAIRARR